MPPNLGGHPMQFSDNLATRIIGTAFEALCFHVCSTSSKTDGGSVGGSGHVGCGGRCGGSSGGVEAHACGAEGGAGGGAIGEADSWADGGAEDRKWSCNRSNKMLSSLSNKASKLSICCLVKPAMVR